jgi:hypothetical protein
MTKSNMVGPWKCHHKLTRILYQSEAECIYQSIEMEWFIDMKTLRGGDLRDCTYSRADQQRR